MPSREMYRIISDEAEMERIKATGEINSWLTGDSIEPSVEFLLEHPEGVYASIRVSEQTVLEMQREEFGLDEALLAIALSQLPYNRPIHNKLNGR